MHETVQVMPSQDVQLRMGMELFLCTHSSLAQHILLCFKLSTMYAKLMSTMYAKLLT